MNIGWIKLHRRLQAWRWYKTADMTHLYIHLILNANLDPSQAGGYTIRRGQLVTGLAKLEDQTGISYQRLRTCLTKLQQDPDPEITLQTTNKFTIITLLKYDEYNPPQVKNVTRKADLDPVINDFCQAKGLNGEYKNVIKTWLNYKAERGHLYKPIGLKTFLGTLYKYSGGSFAQAQSIINYSMQSNYSGIFEPKKDIKQDPAPRGTNNQDKKL